MKSHYVKDLCMEEAGFRFQCVFRVARPELKRTKTGGTYLTFMLADKTGEIETIWWEGDAQHLAQAQQTPYAKIHGKIDGYKGGKQIKVEAAPEWLNEPENLEDYLAVAALPREALQGRLQSHIASVRSPDLTALLDQVFCDTAFRRKFDSWPGAKVMHHACRHGLLQHTLEVTDLACAMVDAQRSWGYVRLSRDLVVAGALLHDIGKVHEIVDNDTGIYGTSPTGELLGHISIGQQLASKKISKIPAFPADLRDALLHIIGSHHGRKEFGSPVEPMFAEAQIVHAADLLNVQLYYIQEATQSAAEDFVKVWKLENRRFSARSWEHLDIPVILPTAVEEVQTVCAPPAVLPQPPGRVGSLPTFRFLSTPDETGANTVFHTRRLPLVGRAAAGVPQFSEQHIDGYFEVEDARLPGGDHYLLQVEGDSMTGDGIQNGGMVLVRRQSTQEPEIISVVYFDDRSEATLKRVTQTDHGDIELLSSNPDYAPISVADPSTLRICGRVVGILQNEESGLHAH